MSTSGFLAALSASRELEISFRGRRTGRTYSTPVWFVAEASRLYLLPVSGSETAWYRNIVANPEMTLSVGGHSLPVQARPITDSAGVSQVIEKFGTKYGAGEIRRWYRGLDVAVEVDMPAG
jgi:deazaflavin-dependent oxidoreductase (nitroreductase family)